MIINGVEYKNRDLTFNAACRLEDMGVSLLDMKDKTLSAARAYAALCMRKPLVTAGNEIEEHVANGGGLDTIIEAFGKAVDESGFFQRLIQQAQEKEDAEEAEPEDDFD